MDKASTFLLFFILYMIAYMSMSFATLLQHKRLLEWLQQWNSQLALKEAPFGALEGWFFFFRKRAAQLLRPQPFLWRERQRFVALALSTVFLFLAYPVIGILLAILYGG